MRTRGRGENEEKRRRRRELLRKSREGKNK